MRITIPVAIAQGPKIRRYVMRWHGPQNVPSLTLPANPRPRTKLNPATGNYGSFRFSSGDLPRAERISFYRDVVWRMMASLDIEPVEEEFACNAHLYCLPRLGIAHVAGSSVRASWTHITAEADKGPGLVLVMNLFGAGTLAQLGREATVPTGSSILFSSSDASRMERSKSRFLLVAVPLKELAPMLVDPDAAMMSVVRNTIEPLRLLPAYIDLLIKDPALLEAAELRRLAVDHIHDLIALTVGATRDAAEIAVGRGLSAARLRAIKADIAQNIAGDVTAAALSARHGLSDRYIRKLFEGENTSLSQFVLGERLIRVHRMLADPRYADRTISNIAFEVGFADLSTFNRKFRRCFGLTPSEVRCGSRLGEGTQQRSASLAGSAACAHARSGR
jgi:AraC-like DNA-binding protein